ncbi:MAG: hypothetical protein A3B74_00620 [Candidatus Kerfeldbacteria bacterium RIFCSPHIGHO2_02_FULL_42_14]|uniref:Spore protein YkvP/CgeB glycosyl transferase-like domain-containing protein n=1 Tax=Candidatus Kerfeldbacteria bacterium RIFCSPHIGHO2_02_FULL_42_14 TaxID=1798540 RepID=A0A1G2ARR0_9BACT|nr:MAG: hypothetical protein A3B74_00620 [Candidatus Kerfeldbacteria bacterium RIFCSPHIGHO2_02_FULL_42_14]OGY81456.1 MAG: hypothetical protein A3E60_05525 [Candidatus Kerfeldbacteria bacterium RIFCSPHIGHO2_12_FULL_42_13]OGY83503.1 MAG: hypothetical protein A3I91_02555 [Candidatus Kerfeldbacteria bacterium RIFCSPLOWO2_02_FULL_42_19]OGY86971.1 MAG: hypothetical protein A3G01_01655 [Candidatus Kerfeldbacteria bacterium RIFCSPLOWO2_12_FULL_43_9]
MKILILDTYYPAFLDDFYHRYPTISDEKYEDQLQALLNQQFGTADFYSKNLRLLGHEAKDIIYNAESLQNKWAQEHNIHFKYNITEIIPILYRYLQKRWPERILLDQIKNYQPDILYIQNVSVLSSGFLYRIKPSLKMLVGQIASPFDSKIDLSVYDLLISAAPNFVQHFRQRGYASERLKIGFESTILSQLKKNRITWNTIFIGGFTGPHLKTTRLLEKVAVEVPIDFWGYDAYNLDHDSPIRQRFHGPVWGVEMYSVLHNSKIAINRHVDEAENYAGNMRIYEVTGTGTLLITDMKDNLGELFKIGEEIETYSSPEELIAKIKFYSHNESARQKIAHAGQQRTLKDHNYYQRMKELIQILKRYTP